MFSPHAYPSTTSNPYKYTTLLVASFVAEQIMRAINSTEEVHCVLASRTPIDGIQSLQVHDIPSGFIRGETDYARNPLDDISAPCSRLTHID